VATTGIDDCLTHLRQLLGSLEWWWWWYPTPSEGWGRGGTPRRPNSRPRPKVWTRGENGRSSAEDGAPERLECGTVKEEGNQILQRVSAGAA